MVEPPLPILYVDQRRVTTRAVTIYQTEHNGTRVSASVYYSILSNLYSVSYQHAIKVLRPTPYDQAQGEVTKLTTRSFNPGFLTHPRSSFRIADTLLPSGPSSTTFAPCVYEKYRSMGSLSSVSNQIGCQTSSSI